MLIQEPPSSPPANSAQPALLILLHAGTPDQKDATASISYCPAQLLVSSWPSTPGLTAHPTLLTYYTSCPWLPFPSAPFSFSLLGTRGSLLTLNPPSACRSSHRTDPLQYISRCYSRTQTFCSLSSATSRNLSALWVLRYISSVARASFWCRYAKTTFPFHSSGRRRTARFGGTRTAPPPAPAAQQHEASALRAARPRARRSSQALSGAAAARGLLGNVVCPAGPPHCRLVLRRRPRTTAGGGPASAREDGGSLGAGGPGGRDGAGRAVSLQPCRFHRRAGWGGVAAERLEARWGPAPGSAGGWTGRGRRAPPGKRGPEPRAGLGRFSLGGWGERPSAAVTESLPLRYDCMGTLSCREPVCSGIAARCSIFRVHSWPHVVTNTGSKSCPKTELRCNQGFSVTCIITASEPVAKHKDCPMGR